MPSLGLYEVLDGFENELELERELGVRAFEFNRDLLVKGVESTRVELGSSRVLGSDRIGLVSNSAEAARTLTDSKQTLIDPNKTLSDSNPTLGPYDFVFLHHDRLSQGGVEMMAKIVTAMKKTPDTAPIVFVGERPAARVYVVLGGIAMKKWFPELRCSPGQWAKGARGEEVLVTYSPEYILRLGPETPAVKKLKLAMWTSLKGVMQKL